MDYLYPSVTMRRVGALSHNFREMRLPNLRVYLIAVIIALISWSGQSAYADYIPSSSVKAAHNIPHLSMYLKLQSSDFGITTSSLTTSNTYVLSLLTLPAIILVAGLISLLIFGLIMVSRCCCTCSTHKPDVKTMNGKNDEEYSRWAQKVICTRITLLVFFSFFLILAFSGAQMGWYGSYHYNDGVNSLSKNFESIAGIFSGINKMGNSFSVSGALIKTQLVNSACTNAHSATLYGYVNTFVSTGVSIASDTKDVYTSLDSADASLSNYAVHNKNMIFWVSYSVVSGFCLLIALGATIQNKVLSQVMFFFTYWLVLLLILASCIYMVPVMLLSDFCYSPTPNIVTAISAGNGSTITSYATYYTTCTGTNPLGNNFDRAFNSTHSLNSTIYNLLQTSCPSDPNLIKALTYLPYINSNITYVQGTVACSNIKGLLDDTFNNSICGNMFTGLWIYFLCVFCISFCLFMVLCFDAVLWHHFDKFYWTLDPIREPSPDEEEGSVRERDDDDDEETEGDVLAHVVVSDGERDRERERGRERDRERAAEDEITGHTSGDSGDSIPPPTRRLTKKPSIFELLVENENEHKQGLKSIEMRDNTNRKMRSRFSMIMSSNPAPPPPTPSAPIFEDNQGSRF